MTDAVRKKNGKWVVDFRPEGVSGARIQRQFKLKLEANAYHQEIIARYKGNPSKTIKKDNRKLSDLVKDWHKLHGSTLKRGHETKQYLLSLCKLLNDPIARLFTAEDFSKFRAKRLNGLTSITNKKKPKKITANTCNHDLSGLKSVFNELKKLNNWHSQNPLADVRHIKTDEIDLTYLDFFEIKILLSELKKSNSNDVYLVAKICLATGCRWTEAEELCAENVRNGQVRFINTKSRKSRTVPINDEFQAEILVGRGVRGRLFCYCYKSFLRALGKSVIDLPKGQASHVLRHSFASHFIMGGGGLNTLKELLGHQDIKMTMRYLHLAPEFLNQAKVLNPLNQMQQLKNNKTEVSHPHFIH